MACFPKEYSGLREIAAINALECMSVMNFRGRRSEIQCPEKIFHPKPRRAAPVSFPFSVDDGGCCKLQRYLFESSNSTQQKEDPCFEIFDIIMTKGAAAIDDDGNSLSSYFCGSPPARTSNPVVHDIQFARQPSLANESPCGPSLAVRPSGRAESRSPSSCAASIGGKPLVRVEGFAAGDSKSHCFVPAFA